MSEFMGNIVGFLPGTASLHSCMAAHGPETEAVRKALTAELAPVRYPENSMQFMFETCYMLKIAPWSVERLDDTYLQSWQGIEKLFVSK